jgi:hypothetical protein
MFIFNPLIISFVLLYPYIINLIIQLPNPLVLYVIEIFQPFFIQIRVNLNFKQNYETFNFYFYFILYLK